ncbi:MAG: hypothetical protein AAFY66_01230, partial [Pseudomonadota bacterium]
MQRYQVELEKLEQIIQKASEAGLSFAEKAGLYGCTFALCQSLRGMVEVRLKDEYPLEKVRKLERHIAAMLEFDSADGHSLSQHHSWALGQFKSLRDTLRERL